MTKSFSQTEGRGNEDRVFTEDVVDQTHTVRKKRILINGNGEIGKQRKEEFLASIFKHLSDDLKFEELRSSIENKGMSLSVDLKKIYERYKRYKDKKKELEDVIRQSKTNPDFKEKRASMEDALFTERELLLLKAYKIPNIALHDVKVGKDESGNEVIRKHGKPRDFSKDGFEPKDHLELGEALDIIDVKRAAKVSGTRFGYLKGDAVLLEFALVQFALETLIKEGFTPIIPPTLIKKESMAAMGYLEHGEKEDMYVLEKDNLVLVGTAEQSIGPMHGNEILKTESLPLRYVGFSSCFRREAGSYGKDTRGILRVHQLRNLKMVTKSMNIFWN
jgi:seryl-tRNA synthetase